MELEQSKYNNLINQIGDLLLRGREQASQSVNTILVQTYWLIGRHIVEFEQDGNERLNMAVFSLKNFPKICKMFMERGLVGLISFI